MMNPDYLDACEQAADRLAAELDPADTDYLDVERRISRHVERAAEHITGGRFSMAGIAFLDAARVALDTPDTDPIGDPSDLI